MKIWKSTVRVEDLTWVSDICQLTFCQGQERKLTQIRSWKLWIRRVRTNHWNEWERRKKVHACGSSISPGTFRRKLIQLSVQYYIIWAATAASVGSQSSSTALKFGEREKERGRSHFGFTLPWKQQLKKSLHQPAPSTRSVAATQASAGPKRTHTLCNSCGCSPKFQK